MTAIPALLVDTHCHLNLAAFEEDLDSVIARAYQAGIRKILIPGTDLASSRQAVSLAKQYPGLYAAVGVHPHDAESWQASTRSELSKLAEEPEVVALGEMGLDYYRNYSDPAVQRQVFRDQLALAQELELPVILHNREAIEDLLVILNEWVGGLSGPLRTRAGVMHAFSANEEAASKAVAMGFYIGIAGPVTFRSAEMLRSVVQQIPLERILTETDAPYLTPAPHRGKRNEPGYIPFVAAAIANTRQVQIDQAIEQMAVNARVLFQWNHEITDNHIL